MAINVQCIETKRLKLRNICEEDTDYIVKWRSDEKVYRYFLSPHPINVDEHLNWYKNKYVMDVNRIDWMAVDNEDEPVGVFGVKKDSSNDDTAEISYIVSPQERGKGYAEEAIGALLYFLESEWNCKYAIAEIHEENKASIHFAAKLGFQLYKKNKNFLLYRKQLSGLFDFKKKIYIRADGNENIGTGHVMRCLSIAEQLKKLGAEVTFITADDSVSSVIKSRGFSNIILQSIWNDLDFEISKLTDLIIANKVDALIIDSYFVTDKYLKALNMSTVTFYIDDLNKMKYATNTLINYNVFADDMNYNFDEYSKLVLGPRYAPLREEFMGVHTREFTGINKILITSGGTDEYDVVGNILDNLSKRDDFLHIEFYCILGRFNKNIEKLNARFGTENNVHFLKNISNMSKYMKSCDIAITAGGTTCYELCACGLPSIIYTLADNQFGVAEAFSIKDIIPWVGDIRDDMKKCLLNINAEIDKLYSKNCWEQRSKRMQELVDGKGAKRLAQIVMGVFAL